MKKLVMLILAVSVTASLFAQPWMKEFEDRKSEPSFYEIQDAFNDYWAKRKYEKGKGYKQFKRWEYFMEPRVDENGYLNTDALYEAWVRFERKSAMSPRSETANWTHMGPDDTPVDINSPDWRRGSGRINCVSFHPTDPDIIFTGAPSGGFWKSTDGGNNWVTTTDHLPSIGVSDIAVDPSDPDIIYIATGDGDARDTYSIGVLKSTDGGDTWSALSLNYEVNEEIIIRRLIIDPDNPQVLIAASSQGIMQTMDGGQTWHLRSNGHFKDIEFKPGDSQYVYAATYEYNGGSTIYRSTNGGLNWLSVLELPESNRIELAVTADDASRIYALASWVDDSGYLGMYRSDDSGTNWTEVHDNSSKNLLGWSSAGSDSGGQGWYDLACAADPNDADNVFVGGVNAWKSTNGGSSWSISAHWYGDNAAYVHADHHTMDFHPLTGDLYSGNDGGLYKTSNLGSSWTDISDGLHILQIYRFGTSVTNPNRLIVGAQDNGSMRYNDGVWNAVLGGDGMEALIDYTDDDVMYAEYYYGAIHRSTDGGYSFVNVQPTQAGDGAWVTPYVIDPEEHQTLYAGFSDVYKTTNRGSSWTAISNNLTGGGLLRNLAVAPSDPDVIYAATYSTLYKTTNGGGSWSTISSGLPGSSISYITVNPTNPDMLWVTLSGYSDGDKVYQTENGGSTWTNYSQGLPNIPANCLVYENGTNHALYVGTDLGVFYRNAGMSEWINFSQGMPNVIVNELEIQYSVNKLRAATYGRGVWESDLFELVAAPTADFTWNVTNGCEGEVQFSSISSGAPDSYRWEFGDGNESLNYSPVHTYATTGVFNVKLVVSNALGEDSITKTFTLDPSAPLVDFSATITTGCEPTEVQFYNLSDEAATWSWDFGDGETSDVFEPEHTYTDLGVFDVSLTAHTSLCPDASETKVSYISFDPSSLAEFSMPGNGYAPEQTCCDGTIYDNGGENGQYSNNTNSTVKIMPVDADQIEFTFLSFDVEAGTGSECDYDRVTIYDGNVPYDGYALGIFCNSNTPSGSYITTGEIALIKQYTDSGVTGEGFELTWRCLSVDYTYAVDAENYRDIDFTDISTNYPISWSWDFGDGSSSDDQNPNHVYSQDGLYEVTLTITNDQGTYTETKNIPVGDVSVDITETEDKIIMYPNPVSDILTIQLETMSSDNIRCEIIDVEGRILLSEDLTANDSSFELNLGSLSSGVYSVRIIQGDEIIVKPISKL